MFDMYDKYYSVGLLADLETGETLEQIDFEKEGSALKSIVEFGLDIKIREFERKLRADKTVDNIWIGYDTEYNVLHTYCVIMYHQYKEDETPNHADPNRSLTFVVMSLSEAKEMAKYNSAEEYRQAVLNAE